MDVTMRKKSKVEELKELLQKRLARMVPGEWIAPVRQLMQEYEVSQLTVVQALVLLETEGLLTKDPGRGYFVPIQVHNPVNESLIGGRENSKQLRIGFVTPDWPSSILLEMEDFLKAVAPEFNSRIVRITYQVGRDIWNRLPIHDFDGFIIVPESDYITIEMLNKVTAAPVPIVFRGMSLKEIQISSVAGDSFAIGGKAAAYLVGRKHRKLALLISEPLNSAVVRDRCEGFKMVAEMGGATVSVIDCGVKPGEYSPEKTYHALNDWLELHHPDFSAMLVITDDTAAAAMRALDEHGIAIPDQVSVMGCGGLRQGAFCHPPLTVVSIDQTDISRCSIQAVIDSIADRSKVIKHLLFPLVIERNSVKDGPQK